jgi:hypothetical protein
MKMNLISYFTLVGGINNKIIITRIMVHIALVINSNK